MAVLPSWVSSRQMCQLLQTTSDRAAPSGKASSSQPSMWHHSVLLLGSCPFPKRLSVTRSVAHGQHPHVWLLHRHPSPVAHPSPSIASTRLPRAPTRCLLTTCNAAVQGDC